MIERALGWRRALGRELTRQMRLSTGELLQQPACDPGAAHRIGFTGPPGAGKSSLIAAIAQKRLQRGREMGVLAVDPTSPITEGSLLGDRIRMDAVADDMRLFIRSAPSGACHDGLCRNIVGMLGAMEAAGFDDIVLETVGVGQVSYEARRLVDTLVLILVPESGDTIQAMKAGILEVADVYVVNKADRPQADRTAAELRAVLNSRAAGAGWRAPVVLASAKDGQGVAEIDEAIDAHRAATSTAERRATLARERRRYQMRSLVQQRFDELATDEVIAEASADLGAAFQTILRHMPMESSPRTLP